MTYTPPAEVRTEILNMHREGKTPYVIMLYVGVAYGIAITEREVKDVIKAN